MNICSLATWVVVGALLTAGTPFVAEGAAKSASNAAAKPAQTEAAPAPEVKPPETAPEKIDKAVCLGCHGNEGFTVPGEDGKPRNLHVMQDKFGASVHGKRQCVDCHQDITQIPHEKKGNFKVSCVQCHEDLWKAAQSDKGSPEYTKLGVVVKQIDSFMKSIHARPNKQDQSRTNATCYNCHDAHYVYPQGSAVRAEWRLNLPNACGKCHAKEREAYGKSVHGTEVLQKANPKAAICSDCHTTHNVEDPGMDSTRLVITKNCGNCHQESFDTYTQTYHGKVNTLGYAYTAKCFDCHGSHGILRVSDPASTVHPDHRLETCQKCHTNATKGFVSFSPHGNPSNFSKYPYLWVAKKFMEALLLGVFAFFWAHSALWFYREYRDRKEGKLKPHVETAGLPHAHGRHFRRFGPVWRLAHLVFALSVMMLVLTGMSVFYAETGWAQSIVTVFGGPRGAAIVHRVCAVTMLGIFFIHLVYLAFRLGRNWGEFDWFGPNSLVPRWEDLRNAIDMFKWFFGKGTRPIFDRWTYWEKFDYWAVFWGMAIIGGTGFMLWNKYIVASVLPGWVFNVATLIHGEEAFLAAVFLFTVHFFNNHFRPDKMPPPDIVMFTGAVPLEEYRREHAAEYNRLVSSGQLEKHLVDAPSRRMTVGSRILGITLILCGLTLLVFVLIGFTGSMGN